MLIGNQQPDHSRISDFRCRNLDALKGLLVQILRLCQKAGMVSQGHGAFDGTKVQANASKHKAMSHERMPRAEKELEQENNALIRKAEVRDAQEDRKVGKGNLGSRQSQRSQGAGDRGSRARWCGITGSGALTADAMSRPGLARKADGTPTAKSQGNFTDPDSPLMQSGGTYLQG
jgi:hypothetical protein